MEFLNFKPLILAESIRSFGYKGKLTEYEDYSVIESATGGHPFYMYCYHRNGSSGVSADIVLIRFKAVWFNIEDFDEREIDHLNNWFNANYGFSKVYKWQSHEISNLAIEADLYVLDGMSSNAFESKFNLFISTMEDYKKQIYMCSRNSKSEIFERHDKAIELVHGENKNFEEAANLYRENSHQGYAGSQNNFGDLFENGTGVPKDDLMALYWYTRSSERGEPTAYLSLASILEKSRENIDALLIAAKYAILAAEKLPEGKNKLSAQLIRDSLKEILSEDGFNYAMTLAGKFKPIYEEKWTMSDAPGPKIEVLPGSNILN